MYVSGTDVHVLVMPLFVQLIYAPTLRVFSCEFGLIKFLYLVSSYSFATFFFSLFSAYNEQVELFIFFFFFYVQVSCSQCMNIHVIKLPQLMNCRFKGFIILHFWGRYNLNSKFIILFFFFFCGNIIASSELFLTDQRSAFCY